MDDMTGPHEHDRGRAAEVALEPTTVVRSRRPKALWGVLAAVAVATGALAISAGGDDAAPGLPVALGAGGAGGRAEAAMDSSMLAWVTYVAADGLPTLGGEASAHRLSGSVSEAQVTALAERLGIDGAVAREGSLWTVQGGGRHLSVDGGMGGQWHFFREMAANVADDVTSRSGGCQPTDDTTCTPTTFLEAGREQAECLPEAACATEPAPGCDAEECEAVDPVPPPRPIEPPPAADLPGEAEARRIALALLADTGMEVRDAEVTIDGPYDAWYVNVEPRVEGLRSGLFASVVVGPEGVVTSANGILGTPERVGRYPILDTRAVIDRANAALNDLGGTGGDVGIGWSGTGAGGDTATCDALTPECGYEGRDDGVVTCRALIPECDPGLQVDPGPACKVQPHGREICEVDPCSAVTTIPVQPGERTDIAIDCVRVDDLPLCAHESGNAGSTGSAGTTSGPDDGAATLDVLDCVPPIEPRPEPGPIEEPAPFEVVLVDVEPALVLLGATDGTSDAYLVPAYRFTAEDGSTVDLPAVADEALAGPSEPEPSPTETTDAPPPPDTVDPGPIDPCEVRVEDDGSGTTLTIVPDPRNCPPATNRVEVLLHCVVITDWQGLWWTTEQVNQPEGWVGTGSITLQPDGTAVYLDDGAPDDPATFTAQGPAATYPGCA
jgi:hypothetical protein